MTNVQRAGDVVDYQQFFVEHLGAIEHIVHFVVRRHQLAPTDKDDFISAVHLRLIEHDYAILRKFEGRSNLNTYLSTVVERLFLDFCNSRWGKWRPSALALKRGHVAVHLERLITRDGLPAREAIETILSQGDAHITRGELEAIAAELPSRVSRRTAGEDELATVEAQGPPVDAGLAAAETATLAEQVQRALRTALTELTDEERLVLKLRFVDGLQVSAIARLIHTDQKGLYRRLEHVMRQMRTALLREGITPKKVDELVGHSEVVVEGVFGARFPEKRPTRPSSGIQDG